MLNGVNYSVIGVARRVSLVSLLGLEADFWGTHCDGRTNHKGQRRLTIGTHIRS